jgi:hypothetical protein
VTSLDATLNRVDQLVQVRRGEDVVSIDGRRFAIRRDPASGVYYWLPLNTLDPLFGDSRMTRCATFKYRSRAVRSLRWHAARTKLKEVPR